MRAALALALVLTCLVRPARADDVAQAKAHFAIAARAYEQNEFRQAIESFEEAYRLAPRPAVLFSIGQAYKRQYYKDRQPRDLARAIVHFRRYLKDDPQGKRVGDAVAALEDLEPIARDLGIDPEAPPQAPEGPQPARISIGTVRGATARIDGGEPIALPARVEVTPGKHTVVIEKRGFQSVQQEVIVEQGQLYPIHVPMMTEKPARLRLQVEDGTRLYVDGRLMAQTPLAGPFEVSSGFHVIALTRRGFQPLSLEVNLAPGELRPVDAELALSSQRISALVIFGLAAVATVGGAVVTGLAASEQAFALDIEEQARVRNISIAERDAHDEAIEQSNLFGGLAFGSFAGGAVLGLVGALMFVLDNPEPPAPQPQPKDKPSAPSEIAITPIFGPAFVGVAATAKF